MANAPTALTSDKVLAAEKAHIGRDRLDRIGRKTFKPWLGIGLSGGGIRSASLSLGVLQGLAEANLLRYFDYVSTVSGGGYIGSSLQWWWLRDKRQDNPQNPQVQFGVEPNNFPYGPPYPVTGQSPPPQQRAVENLAFLRAHGAYLVPGNGLTAWSMLVVLIRTIIISLLTWIPLLVLAVVAVYVLDLLLFEALAKKLELWSPFGTLIPVNWEGGPYPKSPENGLKYPALYAFLMHGVYGILLVFVSLAILFGLLSRSPQDTEGRAARIIKLALTLAVTSGLMYGLTHSFDNLDNATRILIGVCSVFAALTFLTLVAELATSKSLNANYWLRRNLERLLGIAFLPTLTALAISTVPIIPYYLLIVGLPAKYGTISGAVALVGGIGSALYGYYSFIRNIVPSLASQIAATVGSLIYLYVTVVFAYALAIILVSITVSNDPTNKIFLGNVTQYQVHLVQLIGVGFILMALGLGYRANINFVGLHRFYRDRLMEAFMPTDAAVENKISNFSPVADNLSVAALSVQSQTGANKEKPCPYPIINCNVILLNDKNRTHASRGGDNFVVSPLFVGSNATGFQKTDEYIKNNGPLTLASAMAASGAAATASAGYIGTGITLNPLVAAVMSIFNIRLGLWVGNPFHQQARRIRSIPTFLNPGLVAGILGLAHKHDSDFVELTDGGHFENLALYELVRRELDLILIVDGEADPNISLSSLVSASRRIEQDFNARLTFTGRNPDQLMMVPGQGYPAGAKYAQSPFLVGKIAYDSGKVGTLLYIKATLIKGMDFTTSGYLASNPEFPHQSTVDQFFDPDQFDAYRLLGYESARKMITDLTLGTTIATPDKL